jgi:hypothetical protein
MSKELANYTNTGTIVVKRSPAINRRKLKSTSTIGMSRLSDLRNSVNQNIHSLNRVLKESEKIMPRTYNSIKGNKI